MPVINAAHNYGADSELGYDFRPMFEPVADELQAADLAICHLEVPLTDDANALAGYPMFNGPAELADAIAHTGYAGCSTAHNHTLDQGFSGVQSTLDILDRTGLQSAGSARTAEEAETITVYEVDDVAVAQLSYTYGFNGIPLPADAPWAGNLIEADRIIDDAKQARDQGADIIAVSLHWGQEYVHEPTQMQRDLATQLAEQTDIDLIIGHHAHVVQPVEQIDDLLVIYGLGNFLSNQSPGCCATGAQDGMIATVDLEEDLDTGTFDVAGVRVLPTWVDRTTYQILPAEGPFINDDATSAETAAALSAARERTLGIIGDTAVTDTGQAP